MNTRSQGTCQLYICVVLYNTKIEQIRSLEGFQKLTGARKAVLVICDNSTEEEIISHNQQYAAGQSGMLYHGGGGNIGLPKNYNYVLREVAPKDAWVMLSDDDTLFSDAYLSEVLRCIEEPGKEKAWIVTGLIKSGDGSAFSPKKGNQIFANEFLDQPGLYENIYAVNSGLTISRKVYDATDGFDEQLFLDMVDHDFMNDLMKLGRNRILVVPGEISQAFSGTQKAAFRSLYSRFRIFRKDYLYFSKKYHVPFFKAHFVVLKRFGRILLLSL